MSNPMISCTSCDYKCKTKPTMKRHVTTTHTSQKEKQSKKAKKRTISSFNCPECKSNFDTRYKMKKHVINEHEEKKEQTDVYDSPPRKIAKMVDSNDKITEYDDKENLNMDTEEVKDETITEKSEAEKAIEAKESVDILRLKVRLITQNKKMLRNNQDIEHFKKEADFALDHIKFLRKVLEQKNELITKLKVKLNKRKHPKPIRITKLQKEPNLPMVEELEETEQVSIGSKPENSYIFECPPCDIFFKNINDMMKHKADHNHTCQKCGSYFDDVSQLKEHMLLHEQHDGEQEKGPSKEVHEEMETDSVSKSIDTSSSDDGQYTCNDCSYQTNTNVNLQNHIRETKHSVNKTNYHICEICGTEHESLSEFKIHMVSHKSKYKCELCEVSFINKSDLRQHMRRIHKILREDWDKIQSENSTLNDRMNSDTNQNNTQTLEETNKHENDPQLNKISCHLCKLKFRNRNELTDHKREAHKTFKPCRNMDDCEYGDKCYFNHNAVPEGMLRCFQCGTEFNTLNKLMIHRKNIHGNVQTCKKYLNNECQREDTCWWSHRSDNLLEDFPQVKQRANPPIETPSQTNMILNMINVLNTMLTKM